MIGKFPQMYNRSFVTFHNLARTTYCYVKRSFVIQVRFLQKTAANVRLPYGLNAKRSVQSNNNNNNNSGLPRHSLKIKKNVLCILHNKQSGFQ